MTNLKLSNAMRLTDRPCPTLGVVEQCGSGVGLKLAWVGVVGRWTKLSPVWDFAGLFGEVITYAGLFAEPVSGGDPLCGNVCEIVVLLFLFDLSLFAEL